MSTRDWVVSHSSHLHKFAFCYMHDNGALPSDRINFRLEGLSPGYYGTWRHNSWIWQSVVLLGVFWNLFDAEPIRNLKKAIVNFQLCLVMFHNNHKYDLIEWWIFTYRSAIKLCYSVTIDPKTSHHYFIKNYSSLCLSIQPEVLSGSTVTLYSATCFEKKNHHHNFHQRSTNPERTMCILHTVRSSRGRKWNDFSESSARQTGYRRPNRVCKPGSTTKSFSEWPNG